MRPVMRVGEHAFVSPAPAAPGVIVWSWEGTDRLLLRPEGPAVPLRLPTGVLQHVQWLQDGRRAVLGWAGTPDADGKFKREKAIVVDAATGAISQVEAKSVRPWQTPAPEARLRVVRGEAALRDGERTARLTPLWLESVIRTEQPRALLSAFAEKAALSPRADSVLYTDDRGAWVLRPLSIPKEAYFAAGAAAQRAVTLSHGKQLGTALHMYAQDNAERLPGADEPVNSLISPYLKNDALFEGFVYTFGGGPLSSIEKPAEQVLGHVMGPGGRAMIYADGHVRWEPGGG
jgi:hypothetical protein